MLPNKTQLLQMMQQQGQLGQPAQLDQSQELQSQQVQGVEQYMPQQNQEDPIQNLVNLAANKKADNMISDIKQQAYREGYKAAMEKQAPSNYDNQQMMQQPEQQMDTATIERVNQGILSALQTGNLDPNDIPDIMESPIVMPEIKQELANIITNNQ